MFQYFFHKIRYLANFNKVSVKDFLDEFEDNHSDYVIREKMSEQTLEFIKLCMSENLNHARHVENERITFNSVFMALTAAATAFAAIGEEHTAAGVICIGMFCAGVIALFLTVRWSNAFARHLHYAQKCYIILHKHYFGETNWSRDIHNIEAFFPENVDDKFRHQVKKCSREIIKGLNQYPLYCFEIRNPLGTVGYYEIAYLARTKRLYYTFYGIVLVMLAGSCVYSFDLIPDVFKGSLPIDSVALCAEIEKGLLKCIK